MAAFARVTGPVLVASMTEPFLKASAKGNIDRLKVLVSIKWRLFMTLRMAYDLPIGVMTETFNRAAESFEFQNEYIEKSPAVWADEAALEVRR